MNLIEKNIETIRDLCRQHKVSKLFAFGSVLTNEFNEHSDVDLIVDFDKIDHYYYADNYFSLKERFENLFKRHVDLLEEKGIRNPFFRKVVDRKKMLVYG